MWPDRTLLDIFAIDVPIFQAPMAGASDAELAIAVAKAGGLGALPAGMLDGEQIRAQVEQFRAAAKDRPLNLNFLAHRMPLPNNAREHAWRERLKPYYLEFGIDPAAPVAGAARRPFDATACAIVEEIKPAVVSFHYGLPEKELMARVKAAGCKIICSATTVEEARFLETNGCDAII
jgi:nitronate monooxygenase